MSVKMFVAGDIVPMIGQQMPYKNNGEGVFSEIKSYIMSADIAVANLEAPVAKGKLTPIKKSGPNLYTTDETVTMLKEVGFNVLTLANNHFYDQGQAGVENTIRLCKSIGISTVGGGENSVKAKLPLILESKGKRIAIINACEHEFSIAEMEHGGSNPLDLINMQQDITNTRRKVDFVVVIIHGGIEYYPYPTPRMKRWYRHFIDMGADAVINHHQHCINGYEVYHGKPIFYGLGNFYFPELVGVKESSTWGCGYAICLTLDDSINFNLIPYHQDGEGIVLRNQNSFKEEIELLNLPITNDLLLQQKFDEYVSGIERKIKAQLLPSFMQGHWVSRMARYGLFGNLYKGKQVFSLKNKLSCESHYETLLELFNILVKR